MTRQELLQAFCSDNELRPRLSKPFRQGDYTCATDVPISHILEWAKSWGYGKKGVTHGNMVIQFEKD